MSSKYYSQLRGIDFNAIADFMDNFAAHGFVLAQMGASVLIGLV